MGRAYAGILGLLAMSMVMLRGVLHGAGLESTFSMATISLISFAAVGFVLGTIAESTVDEAVRSRIERQLADLEQA